LEPRAVRVLILEIARSPAGHAVNRGSVFGEVIRMSEQMFERAKRRGELKAEADPRLCAALLFGSVEMALTLLVLGQLDAREEADAERLARQVAESFLTGVQPASGAEIAWKTKPSSTKSKALRRS
jgi:TetR/AcrR family fatty acid metabolism transcriptional regulator